MRSAWPPRAGTRVPVVCAFTLASLGWITGWRGVPRSVRLRRQHPRPLQPAPRLWREERDRLFKVQVESYYGVTDNTPVSALFHWCFSRWHVRSTPCCSVTQRPRISGSMQSGSVARRW